MIPIPLSGSVYQAIPGFEDHLKKELGTTAESLNAGSLFFKSCGGEVSPLAPTLRFSATPLHEKTPPVF